MVPVHRLQARAGRHRVEAAQLALSLGALARLDRKQEPERSGREAGSVGPVTNDATLQLDSRVSQCVMRRKGA
jgi:hypothetical protein